MSNENHQDAFKLMKRIIDSLPDAIAAVWQDVLLSSMESMSSSLLEKDILPYAIQKGSLSETEENRCFCARLLGSLTTRLSFQCIKVNFLQKAIDLCQDTSLQVRKTMASEMVNFAKGLGYVYL